MNEAKVLEFPTEKQNEYKASKSRYKTVHKHLDRVNRLKGVYPKKDISALTKLLNSEKWEKDSVIQGMIQDLRHDVNNVMPERSIEKHQSDFGIQWLRDNFVMKRGGGPKALLRKAIENCYQGNETTVLHVVKTFKCFKFVGVHVEYHHYNGEPAYHYPIYRTYAKDGSYFDYTPIQWSTPIIHVTWRAF